MSTSYVGLPRTIIDPSEVRNSNYEYRQVTLEATGSSSLYSDALLAPGIYLYEARVAGVGGAHICTFKRTFSVRMGESAELLDVSSDYSSRSSAELGITVVVSGSVVSVAVTGPSEPIKWVLSLTKTFFTL